MADVVVICPKCNKEVTVSEHVDLAALKCLDCKENLVRKDAPLAIMEQQKAAQESKKLTLKHAEPPPPPMPPPDPAQGKTKLGLAKKDAPKQPENPSQSIAAQTIANAAAQAAAAAPQAAANGWQVTQEAHQQLLAKEEKHGIGPAGWSWIIFILLGGTMGFLRYGGVLPPDILSSMKIIGPIIVIIIALIVLLEAFKDSMFAGVLSVIIPFYWLYYLFTYSDNFYLRAITAGLFVGIGEDSGLFFWQQIQYGIVAGNNAIRGV